MPIVEILEPWDSLPPPKATIEFKVNGAKNPYMIIIKSENKTETINISREIAMSLIKDWS